MRGHRTALLGVACALAVLVLTAPAAGADAVDSLSAVDEETDRSPSIADSLRFPGEVIIIPAEEFIGRNVHTLEDILEILPGVIHWIAGPRGSRSGFSIDGRGMRGATLLLNGKPFNDPYTFEPLARFLPLSRLERVEVIYSGSPLFTGDVSTNGAINIVIREGGERGPSSVANFTFGKNNRRARRLWFSTPQSRIGATVAYDEYLQDAFESYIPAPTRRIGDYDVRSVLMDLFLETERGDRVLVRLNRYEDTYVGTAVSSVEDIRYEGFGTEIRYRNGGFSASIDQRHVSLYRRLVRRADLQTAGTASWEGVLGATSVKLFASAQRTRCRHTEEGVAFDPSFHRIEAGAVAGGAMSEALAWRFGVFGGGHSAAGPYLGGEAGIRGKAGRTVSFGILGSRRLRVPSAEELFRPRLAGDAAEADYAHPAVGNEKLSAETTDELALSASRRDCISLDAFARREKLHILPAGSDPAVYRNEGTATVLGMRARFNRSGSVAGFRYAVSAGAAFFAKRSPNTIGIPEYRCIGAFTLERNLFKSSETLSLRCDAEVVGERDWDGVTLGSYAVNNAAASMTLLGATITVQMKNLLDASYETYPGFKSPERHYVIGVYWKFLD